MAKRSKSGEAGGDGVGGLSQRWLAAAGIVAVAAAIIAYRARELLFRPAVLSPLRAPKLKILPEFDAAYKDRMLWGSYRSGLYFGMRTRTPKGLVSGLMWFDPDDPNTLNQMRCRHEASQADGLATYGWTRHDGRMYGSQQLVDGEYNISLSMVKSFANGSGPGGDWTVRLGVSRTAGASARRRRISLVLYLGDEARPTAPWLVLPDGDAGSDLRSGAVALMHGGSAALGPRGGRFAVHMLESTPASVASARSRGCRLDYLSLGTEGGRDYLLRIRDLMLSTMYERLERQPSSDRFHLYLPNGAATTADLALFQLTCPLPATVDLAFTSAQPGAAALPTKDRLRPLLGKGLTATLAAREAEFDARFESVFGSGIRRTTSIAATAAATAATSGEGEGGAAAAPPSERDAEGSGGGSGAEGEAGAPAATPEPRPRGVVEVSRAALSNLLGSIGYFYGHSLVRVSPEPGAPPRRYWDAPLFTAVPSRSFFPRGFLWDEGFHQLLVQKWDPQLSRDMMAHWLDLMNAHGWIPREQILGDEARARVPPEFVVQHPAHANPPSLFLPIARMAEQLREQRQRAAAAAAAAAAAGAEGAGGVGEDAADADDAAEAARVASFLRAAWPRLEAWYRWFNTTQAGPQPRSYRWHGRDASASAELNPKTLTSGLDDYPRASHPDDAERHLDLRCWMALAARAMADIGDALGLPAASVSPYAADAAALSDLSDLMAQHYDARRGWFADWGNHTEEVTLVGKYVDVPGAEGQAPQRKQVSERVARTPPVPQYVPQFGYVSLFPLIMRLLPAGGGGGGSSGAGEGAGEGASGGGAALTLAQLELLRDASLLWSDYGLRSLASTASLYKKRNTVDDPPYWRGQIWMNVNYLVLRALAHYARGGGGAATAAANGTAAGAADPRVAAAAAAAHDELRSRLLRNVVRSYKRYGYLYEQYDDESGRGTSSHPFTGWTALITLIAAQEY